MNTAVNNEPRISAVEITDEVIAATLDDGRFWALKNHQTLFGNQGIELPLRAHPILDLQGGYPDKLLDIVGDQNQPLTAGMTGDMNIIDADWLTRFCKSCPYGAVMLRSFWPIRQNLQPAAEIFNH